MNQASNSLSRLYKNSAALSFWTDSFIYSSRRHTKYETKSFLIKSVWPCEWVWFSTKRGFQWFHKKYKMEEEEKQPGPIPISAPSSSSSPSVHHNDKEEEEEDQEPTQGEEENHLEDLTIEEEGEIQLLNDDDEDEDDVHISAGMDHIYVSAPSGLVVNNSSIRYASYESEGQMPAIMRLIQKDLSEPYSVYTYRYFIHNWPKLCFLASDEAQGDRMIGAIVCKLDVHKQMHRRGYIAMLAVDERYRRKKIGSNLVLQSIKAMMAEDADEIVLETEITNKSALRLYENLGFVRDKRLFRYYLNGVDALRLKLWLK